MVNQTDQNGAVNIPPAARLAKKKADNRSKPVFSKKSPQIFPGTRLAFSGQQLGFWESA
ncbi:MAG: hypothetical protein M3367_19735 [Acidobacteriota bacterium]|nr:hypothetical protein [Acidobacteriota bacterium]